MPYVRLNKGIFNDSKKLRPSLFINGGVLFPERANSGCEATDEAYLKDLHAFMVKWFGGVDAVEGDCGHHDPTEPPAEAYKYADDSEDGDELLNFAIITSGFGAFRGTDTLRKLKGGTYCYRGRHIDLPGDGLFFPVKKRGCGYGKVDEGFALWCGDLEAFIQKWYPARRGEPEFDVRRYLMEKNF